MKTKITNCRIVDSYNMEVTKGEILINGKKIEKVGEKVEDEAKEINARNAYAIPGFIDAHVHIESSLLTPRAFAWLVSKHGTTAIVSDPHEICNIVGIRGLDLFIKESEKTDIDMYFVIPSCVPATELGTSGARIGVKEIEKSLKHNMVLGLGEVMDFPAVIVRDRKIMAKIKTCRGKIVNGHAPLLTGEDMKKYFGAGITDDHESLSYAEMKEKAEYGVTIFLREGSAETSTAEQYKIIQSHPDSVCFCSDDKIANDLENNGSILFNVNKAIKLGYDPLTVIRCATYNPAAYYGLGKTIGRITPGSNASFFLSKSLRRIKPEVVFSNGMVVDKGYNKTIRYPEYIKNTIKHCLIRPEQLVIKNQIRGNIIVAKDGSLHTEWKRLTINGDYDIKKDILKIAVIERYRKNGSVSVANITGFGIKKGAIASSVAHDCHNIISVGTSDHDITRAVNQIIKMKGGFAAYCKDNGMQVLRLPVAGIMSDDDPNQVITQLDRINKHIQKMGCTMKRPLGTLSFMALEVIPDLKITDKGLVDVKNSRIIS